VTAAGASRRVSALGPRRTKAYEELRSGRLRGRKIGRTIIPEEMRRTGYDACQHSGLAPRHERRGRRIEPGARLGRCTGLAKRQHLSATHSRFGRSAVNLWSAAWRPVRRMRPRMARDRGAMYRNATESFRSAASVLRMMSPKLIFPGGEATAPVRSL
jgi:hypothetical protein